MPKLEDAIGTAALWHGGQVDKAGEPYILHPLRVMLQFKHPTLRMIAVLHDLVEDTPVTIEELRREGYPESVLAALDAITRRRGDTYDQYITRVRANQLATQVKLADLQDNLSPDRCHVLDAQHRDRYLRAFGRLS